MKTHAEVSKFLSYILRHNPDHIGISLDLEGWALIDDIINKADMNLSYEIIQDVVSTNKKQRFSVSSNGMYIRANQGHSINVNLGLKPKCPPDILYHGTAKKFLHSILEKGILPQQRLYVHLSYDIKTAEAVARRHGKPVILEINSKKMYGAGHTFFLSENGVWMAQKVPIQYIN